MDLSKHSVYKNILKVGNIENFILQASFYKICDWETLF